MGRMAGAAGATAGPAARCASAANGVMRRTRTKGSDLRMALPQIPAACPYTILDARALDNVTGVCRHWPPWGPSPLSPELGLCYNQKAVKDTGKQESAPANVRGDAVVASAGSEDPAAKASGSSWEDASRFCPICSQRLESRRCKLVCSVCGYYMSCADYY